MGDGNIFTPALKHWDCPRNFHLFAKSQMGGVRPAAEFNGLVKSWTLPGTGTGVQLPTGSANPGLYGQGSQKLQQPEQIF